MATTRRLDMIAIGASTGGIDALQSLLSDFPTLCPPTIIVQHMRSGFLKGFATRLNRHCPPEIRIAEDGDPLVPGQVLLAPDNARHTEVVQHYRQICRLNDGPKVTGHQPSVDVLFNSVARLGGARAGILLTGMGRDGAMGLLKLRQSGAETITQDEMSSTVYGMPRAAVQLGASQRSLPLDRISPYLFGRDPGAPSRAKAER